MFPTAQEFLWLDTPSVEVRYDGVGEICFIEWLGGHDNVSRKKGWARQQMFGTPFANIQGEIIDEQLFAGQFVTTGNTV